MFLIIKPNTKISFFDKIGRDLGLVDLVDCLFVKKLIASPRLHAITLETQLHTLDLRLKAYNVIRILIPHSYISASISFKH